LDADTAKKYHNQDLVDYSHAQGSNARIWIPFINGKGHTELRPAGSSEIETEFEMPLEHLWENKEIEQVVVAGAKPSATNSGAQTEGVSLQVSETTQIEMDLGMEDVEREALAKQQRNKALQQSNEAAELCPECGSVMVAQGTCFYCQECGATTGCS
jgi:hypothetical protein